MRRSTLPQDHCVMVGLWVPRQHLTVLRKVSLKNCRDIQADHSSAAPGHADQLPFALLENGHGRAGALSDVNCHYCTSCFHARQDTMEASHRKWLVGIIAANLNMHGRNQNRGVNFVCKVLDLDL